MTTTPTKADLGRQVCRTIGTVIPPSARRNGVSPEMSLRGDLGMDSVGLMSVLFLLEEAMGIDAFTFIDDLIGADHVADIIDVVHEVRRAGHGP